jgi:hypothetical protein
VPLRAAKPNLGLAMRLLTEAQRLERRYTAAKIAAELERLKRDAERTGEDFLAFLIANVADEAAFLASRG